MGLDKGATIVVVERGKLCEIKGIGVGMEVGNNYCSIAWGMGYWSEAWGQDAEYVSLTPLLNWSWANGGAAGLGPMHLYLGV